MPIHIFTCKTKTQTLLVLSAFISDKRLNALYAQNKNVFHMQEASDLAVVECQPTITARLPVISHYLKLGGEAFMPGILKNQIVLSAWIGKLVYTLTYIHRETCLHLHPGLFSMDRA